MSLMKEYINKRLNPQGLEKELLKLITAYNNHRKTYLLVYAAAIGKLIPQLPLDQEDFYVIRDLLAPHKGLEKIDLYIETPGGSGEAAEEIVRFIRKNFDNVSFVVSGEAKSAGTLLVLSGDQILMTETGSLGPIDAQIRVGRTVISAYDYMEWVNDRRKEAEDKGTLNPFDAQMIAQITPGELGRVYHALEYAKEIVEEWLFNYKFRKWDFTDTRKMPVTPEMKREKAAHIAEELAKHSKWRLHGRSIKASDLEDIGLKIIKVDEDEKLADIVYRIQTICRLFFFSTHTFKIFATKDDKIFKNAAEGMQAPFAVPSGPIPMGSVKGKLPPAMKIEQVCPRCGTHHKVYCKFVKDKRIDEDLKIQGCIPFPKDGKLICSCGFEIDLLGLKNQIEMQTGKKIILD